MNRLSSDLKGLMRWARRAPAPLPPPASFPFSQRVARAWTSQALPDPLTLWQNAVWRSALAATAVILLGLALLAVQHSTPASPYDFSPAYEIVSSDLIP
jgi:hypothetical protein